MNLGTLVVADASFMATVVASKLRAAGYDVVAASADNLAELRVERVLSDLNLRDIEVVHAQLRVKLPKQWRHWCRLAGLRPSGRGPHRDHWAWFYLVGHGRMWRVNDRNELECGDRREDFNRWALCSIQRARLPATEAGFLATVHDLLDLHGRSGT